MTTTNLTKRRPSFPPDFAPGGSIDDLMAYQQAVPAKVIGMVTDKFFYLFDRSISTETVRPEYVNHLTSFVNGYLGKLAYSGNQNAYFNIRDDFLHIIVRKLEGEKFLAEALDELAELDDYAKTRRRCDPSSLTIAKIYLLSKNSLKKKNLP